MDDAVVARLGEWSLRKSDVYDHLMEQDPDQVRAALAVMLSQRVVAKRCGDEGILIDDEELRIWFVGHFAQLKRRVTLDYGKSVGVERYLRVTYGQSVDQYQRIAVDRERDFRLMAHVVRFAQLTEDRVRLRLLSVPDRIEAKRLRRKIAEGADFERLARQTSSHSSREKGGQLDPMWTASLNVALKEAVAGLEAGKISGVVDSRDELGRRQFFIIQLLERIPGRAESYAQLKDEIEKGLAKSPLATSEFVMWQARINNQVELVPAVR
jgi:parvulin-like peptidyl-prolyl isomerase